jgi:hypothetical protein
MVVLPEGDKKSRKFYSIYDKNGKVIESMIRRISWKEKPKKQKYDKVDLTQKIGLTDKPWIKSLKQKAYVIPLKISTGSKYKRKK